MNAKQPVQNKLVSVAVEIEIQHCLVCGILFGFPTDYYRMQIRATPSDEEVIISCPRGHRMAWDGENASDAAKAVEPETTKPRQLADDEAKRRKLIELHELEQAEARNRDADAKSKRKSGRSRHREQDPKA